MRTAKESGIEAVERNTEVKFEQNCGTDSETERRFRMGGEKI